jgi:hypothetical protein
VPCWCEFFSEADQTFCNRSGTVLVVALQLLVLTGAKMAEQPELARSVFLFFVLIQCELREKVTNGVWNRNISIISLCIANGVALVVSLTCCGVLGCQIAIVTI